MPKYYLFTTFLTYIHLFIDGDKSRCFTDDDESIKENTIAIVTGQIKGGKISKDIFILSHLQKNEANPYPSTFQRMFEICCNVRRI